MKKRLTLQERQAAEEFAKLVKSIIESSSVNDNDSHAEIEARKKRLEAQPEEWFRYYFKQDYKCEPASFHRTATKRILTHDRIYYVRAWSRELAKTSRAMMEFTYLALTQEIRNILVISNSYDNAKRILLPVKTNLELNKRILQDYGEQRKIGTWDEGEIVTKQGVSWRAIGAYQSPRGTKNDSFRPDAIWIDDFDTDEDCRNAETLKNKWSWIEEALIPTMSVSGKYRILFNGNIIAKDCCIKRAIAKAKSIKKIGFYEIINIRDKNGKSTWPEKNSEEDIDTFLSMLSASAGQKEFFNNPISEGKIFKNIRYGKIPPLRKFKFVIIYGDPAPGESRKKGTSFKAVWMVGQIGTKFYIIDGFLEKVVQSTFIDWYFKLYERVGGQTNVYCYMENLKFQDPFFQKVFKPLNAQKKKETGINLTILGDTEPKTDKPTRIESNLEPLNSDGDLIFNEDEKGNPHMEELETQFKLFDLNTPYPVDGPDCIEGGHRMVLNKLKQTMPLDNIPRTYIKHWNKYRR